MLIRVKDVCNKNKYNDDKTVYEVMLVQFFQDKVLNQAKKTQIVKLFEFDKEEEQDFQTLKYNFRKKYKTAFINLSPYQVLRDQKS